MKIAVCISGLWRQVSPDCMKLYNRTREIFSEADFYYHTWDEHLHKIPENIRSSVLASPEPVINYHPVYDVSRWNKNDKFSTYRAKILNKEKMAHASKQILAHAFLVDNLKKEYDIIIRTRWDAVVSDKIDYNKIYEMVLNRGPVGAMNRTTARDNKDLYVIQEEIPSNNSWYGYLPDAIIFHTPKHFDTKRVYQLHEDKELWAAEWGWYQVMSEPYGDIHTSLRGGVLVAT